MGLWSQTKTSLESWALESNENLSGVVAHGALELNEKLSGVVTHGALESNENSLES